MGKLQNALKDKGVCVALTWRQSSQTNDLRKKLILDYDDDDHNNDEELDWYNQTLFDKFEY